VDCDVYTEPPEALVSHRNAPLSETGRLRLAGCAWLARKVDAGTARIRSATLSLQRGRWHVAFSVEVDEPAPIPRRTARVVGVDLGITQLAVLSTGEHVANSRRRDHALRGLRRTQRACARRRGPDRWTRREPSNRWRKARARADRIHTRVAKPTCGATTPTGSPRAWSATSTRS
jgi:transposase